MVPATVLVIPGMAPVGAALPFLTPIRRSELISDDLPTLGIPTTMTIVVSSFSEAVPDTLAFSKSFNKPELVCEPS